MNDTNPKNRLSSTTPSCSIGRPGLDRRFGRQRTNLRHIVHLGTFALKRLDVIVVRMFPGDPGSRMHLQLAVRVIYKVLRCASEHRSRCPRPRVRYGTSLLQTSGIPFSASSARGRARIAPSSFPPGQGRAQSLRSKNDASSPARNPSAPCTGRPRTPDRSSNRA